jgi:hypothetical protein
MHLLDRYNKIITNTFYVRNTVQTYRKCKNSVILYVVERPKKFFFFDVMRRMLQRFMVILNMCKPVHMLFVCVCARASKQRV